MLNARFSDSGNGFPNSPSLRAPEFALRMFICETSVLTLLHSARARVCILASHKESVLSMLYVAQIVWTKFVLDVHSLYARLETRFVMAKAFTIGTIVTN